MLLRNNLGILLLAIILLQRIKCHLSQSTTTKIKSKDLEFKILVIESIANNN